ncbi:MAG: ABC-2 transporter permease [Clostridiales bacterium]|nr:ABC-2 transporter permease [Clostridiales bacterium]
MLGILKKDFLIIRKQLGILAALIIFYMVLSFLSDSSGMMGAVGGIVAISLPMNCMAYDEKCKWDLYARSLPLPASVLVLSKYLLSILLYAAVLVMFLPITCLVHIRGEGSFLGDLLLFLIIGMGSVLSMSILYPILFRWGVEKTRIAMFFLVAIPVGLGVGLSFITDLSAVSIMPWIHLLYWAAPLFTAACLVGSYFLSVYIYKRKEV